jgi:type I restriction enzyme S subunit
VSLAVAPREPHWRTVCLGDVADLCLGKMLDAKKNKGNLFPYLRNPNIRWFEVDTSDLKMMPFEDHELQRFGLRGGDVLVCEGGEAGRAAIWDGRLPDMKFQKAVHRVRPAPELYNRFLVHRLKADFESGRIAEYYTGTTIKHLTGQDLARYRFPLPPLREQRRIAAILDKADELRAKRLAALEQLDRLIHSMFLEAVGDPVANPKDWPVVTLGDICVRKPNNGIFRKNQEYGDGIPVVWVEELFRGNAIDTSQSRRLKPTDTERAKYALIHGDILFCRSSLKLGGIGYNNVYLGQDAEALFECHVIRVSPNLRKVEPTFLNTLLRMPSQRLRLLQQSKTVTMTTIDQEGLLRINIPLPPIAIQHQFACRMRALEGLRSKQILSSRHCDSLFAALQHRAFTGAL